MDPHRVAQLLIFKIEKVDCHRSPFKLFPRNFFYTLMHDKFDRSLKQYDPQFDKELDSFFRNLGKKYITEIRGVKSFVEAILFFFISLGLPWLVAVSFSMYFNLTFIFTVLIGLVVLSILILLWLLQGRKRGGEKIARAGDEELKMFAQKVIEYTIRFFKEHSLNPTQFPIELRHNDYEDLTYEKVNQKYMGYLILEVD